MTPAGKVRACRVCGCTEDRACAGGCHWLSDRDDLCSACAPALDHVVRMTSAYSALKGGRMSVATCPCGWASKLPAHHHMRQDRRIQRHWQAVVAGGAA